MTPWRRVGRALDFLLLTGAVGLLVAALGLALARPGFAGARIGLAGVVGLAGAMHIGLSVLRAWRGEARRTLIFAAPLAAGIPVIVVLGGPRAIEIAATIAALVVPIHVAVQALRVTGATLMRANVPAPRALLFIAASAGAGSGMLGLLAGPRAPLLVRGAPEPELARVLAAGLCVVAVVGAVAAASRVPKGRAIVVLSLVLPPLLLCFPLVVDGTIGADWYFTGPIVAAHAMQLLAIAWFVEPRIARIRERSFDPWAHLGLAVVVGGVVTAVVPWTVARVGGLDPTTILIAVTSVVTVLHALVDLPTWSLKDTQIIRVVGQETAPAKTGRTEVSNARALAFTLPCALLVFASFIEPLQAWLLRPGARNVELALAKELAPNDARVRADRAALILNEGHLDEAEALLRPDPYVFSPELDRLRVTVCALRDKASTKCFDTLPPWLVVDVEVLSARVERQIEHDKIADALFVADQLAQAHPRDPIVAAVRAAVLARKGQISDARPTLAAALAEKDALDFFGAPELVRPAFEYARILRHDHQYDAALTLIDQVIAAGADVSTPELVVDALGEQARIYEAKEDPRGELASFQRALRISDYSDAPAVEAQLWLDYLALLARSAATPAARYTALLGADREVQRLAADDPAALELGARVRELRPALEGEVPAEERKDIEEHLERNLDDCRMLHYEAPTEG